MPWHADELGDRPPKGKADRHEDSEIGQSYEETRDSTSCGTSLCSTVSHSVFPTTIDTKAANAPSASTAVGKENAKSSR